MRSIIRDPERTEGSLVKIPTVVKALLRRIGQLAAAQAVEAYAVGGCVRDWHLGITTVTDVDMTVEGSGIALAQAAARLWGTTATAHQQFGTATLVIPPAGRGEADRQPVRIDFAMCRKETYVKPAAYPGVEAGTIEEDLFRRDFTINAIALAVVPGRFGVVVDPFHGAEDLRKRLLRVLHARSFLDDPSRILRGIRFARRFGLRWEAKTERLLHEAIAAGALGWLNAGRLHKELALMLDEPDPKACWEHLAELLMPAPMHG
jgi:tRNA nucleotidyltransferase (CCA-adding enzyme)